MVVTRPKPDSKKQFAFLCLKYSDDTAKFIYILLVVLPIAIIALSIKLNVLAAQKSLNVSVKERAVDEIVKPEFEFCFGVNPSTLIDLSTDCTTGSESCALEEVTGNTCYSHLGLECKCFSSKFDSSVKISRSNAYHIQIVQKNRFEKLTEMPALDSLAMEVPTSVQMKLYHEEQTTARFRPYPATGRTVITLNDLITKNTASASQKFYDYTIHQSPIGKYGNTAICFDVDSTYENCTSFFDLYIEGHSSMTEQTETLVSENSFISILSYLGGIYSACLTILGFIIMAKKKTMCGIEFYRWNKQRKSSEKWDHLDFEL